MRKYCYYVSVIAALFLITSNSSANDIPWTADYLPGTVNFKVLPQYRSELPVDGAPIFGNQSIDVILAKYDVHTIERTFPHCQDPLPEGVDLRLWYTAKFLPDAPISEICEELNSSIVIDVAEPWFIMEYCYEYNDDLIDDQWALIDYLECDLAHDISTGDPSVTVAIIDSGCDMDHPDLDNNYWINPGEDIDENGIIDEDDENGEDDDDNGYVDDFYGWDLVSDDNDPNDRFGHGTHCAGIASAETNNDRGIASVGHDCTIMAIRAGDQLFITEGYPGVVYATDNGVEVISMSWGSGQWFRQGQDVMDYAYERDVMLFGATGNDGVTQEFYPAAFDNVISVGATRTGDRRANFSNYGDWVDCAAPGQQIASTYHSRNSPYVFMHGTSMACPMAAGVGALIRAAFPRLSNEEATDILFEGCEEVDDDGLGHGRVNAYLSLLAGNVPALTISELTIVADENDNGRLDPDETAEMSVTITNEEGAEDVESMTVTITSFDMDLSFESDVVEIDGLESGASINFDTEPFLATVSENAIEHTTWIIVTVEAEPGEIFLEKEFEVVIGHPDILIIDDDDGDDLDRWYYSAVERMGEGWVRWNVYDNNSTPPSDSLMLDHDIVIWTTGNADPPLSSFDKVQMETAITFGANIWLAGKNIGDDRDNGAFIAQYFGAFHEEDSVAALFVNGISDDRPVDEDAKMLLNNSSVPNGHWSPSAMSLAEDSDSLVIYTWREDGEYVSTGLAGVYKEDPFSGSRLVYTGFGLEGIGTSTTSRHEFTEMLANWLGNRVQNVGDELISGKPYQFKLDPAYPNPFNSSTRISFTVPVSGSYSLGIYDIAGRQVSELKQGEMNSGVYHSTWNASSIPAGIYFARLHSGKLATVQRKLVLIK